MSIEATVWGIEYERVPLGADCQLPNHNIAMPNPELLCALLDIHNLRWHGQVDRIAVGIVVAKKPR
jgi:hypothetical protein